MTLHVSRKALEDSLVDTGDATGPEQLDIVLASLRFRKVVVDYFIPEPEQDEDTLVTIRVDRSKLASLQTFLTNKDHH